MTKQETIVVNKIVEVWNEYLKLPVEHTDDIREFRDGIHNLQAKIMMGPTRRNKIWSTQKT